MDPVEQYVKRTAEKLADTARIGVKIIDYLESGELGPLARQAMEKQLENVNYRLQSGAGLIKAYREYLRKQAVKEQPVAAPAPQVEVPETIEARLVA